MVVFDKASLFFKNKLILLDVDGTIVSDSTSILTEKTKSIIFLMREDNDIYLCSNSSDRDRIEELAYVLEVKVVESRYKKPSTKILDYLPTGRDVIVIGDKWLTDGLFAININASFIKVKSQINGEERLVIIIINCIDITIGRFILWLRKIF